MGKFIRRIITLAVVIAVIVGAVVVYNSTRAQPGAQSGGRNFQAAISDKAVVDVGNLVLTVTATGSLAAARESNLSFDLSGIVRQISVQEGQTVSAGQALAVLDDTDLQSNLRQAELNLQAAQVTLDKILQPVDPSQIAIAEANVKAAQGNLQSKASTTTKAAIAAAQAKYQQAVADKSYADKLLNDAGGRYPKDDPSYQLALAQAGQAGFNMEIARLNLVESQKGSPTGAANANIALSLAKLAQVKAGPKQSDIDTAQQAVVNAQVQVDQAKKQLAKATLVAPFAGTITHIYAQKGAPTSGTAIVLTDLSTLAVTVKVDEADILHINPGQKVDMTLDALPGVQITGKVDRIYPIADISASVITYPVRVVLDKTQQPIRAGMTANATFYVKEVDSVVRVPNKFVRINATTGQATVSILNPTGNGVTTVPIKLGVAGSDYTEVIEGLTAGETVALVAQTARTQQSTQGQ